MAAGDVTILGPYLLNDTTTMDTDITAAAGGAASITSWVDDKNVYFAVVETA